MSVIMNPEGKIITDHDHKSLRKRETFFREKMYFLAKFATFFEIFAVFLCLKFVTFSTHFFDFLMSFLMQK